MFSFDTFSKFVFKNIAFMFLFSLEMFIKYVLEILSYLKNYVYLYLHQVFININKSF